MNFHYGMVVGIDHDPSVRLMVTSPATGSDSSPHGNWWAVVLSDDGTDPWPVGQRVTISPDNKGIIIIEETL